MSALGQITQLGFSHQSRAWDPGRVTDWRRAVAGFTDQHKLSQYSGALQLFKKRLRAELDLKHSHRDFAHDLRDGRSGVAGRLDMTGSLDQLRYWGASTFKSEGFTDGLGATPYDQSHASSKLGAEWTLKYLKPKAEVQRFQDNVGGETEKSQTITSKGLLSMVAGHTDWPEMTLSYQREQREKADAPGAKLTEERVTESFRGRLQYGLTSWNAFTGAAMTVTADHINLNNDTTLYEYSIGGSYRPAEGLSLTPSMRLTETYTTASSNRTESISGSIGLTYAFAPAAWRLSVRSSVVATNDSDVTLDNRRATFSFGLEKDLSPLLNLRHREQTIIVKIDHEQYADLLEPKNDTSEVSAFLLLRLTP